MTQTIVYALFYSTSVFLMLLVSTLIFVRHRSGQSKYFALFSFCIAFWVLSQFISQIFYKNTQVSYFFLELTLAFSSYLGWLFLNFALSYTRRRLPRGYWWFIPFVLSIFAFTHFVIVEADISSTGIAVQEAGVVYFMQLLFTVVCFFISLWVLFKFILRRDVDKQERKEPDFSYTACFS